MVLKTRRAKIGDQKQEMITKSIFGHQKIALGHQICSHFGHQKTSKTKMVTKNQLCWPNLAKMVTKMVTKNLKMVTKNVGIGDQNKIAQQIAKMVTKFAAKMVTNN